MQGFQLVSLDTEKGLKPRYIWEMKKDGKSLKVAINAQLEPNRGCGGIEQALIALIHSLGQLKDGVEEYIVIVPWNEPEWLIPYIGANQRIVRGPAPNGNRVSGRETIKRALGPFTPYFRLIRDKLFYESSLHKWPEISISDGFYEKLACDLIHFPFQQFILCAMATVYNPHDLQHLHFPQFFSADRIAWRETIISRGCHFAHTVVVSSEWVKKDLMRNYRLDPDKIQVIPMAPFTQVHPEPTSDKINAIRRKFHLEKPFAIYPAMTWEHKNHIRLLRSLALLREREGIRVELVCTGHKNAFWEEIQREITKLELQEQVKFTGLVHPSDLRAIYRLAQFAVIPTLFEAASGPIFEAWQEEVPVACSTVTSLPEQVGNAALLFDPFSVEGIATAVKRLVIDESLRKNLIQRGKERLKDFSWERTAKAYRAVYRQATNRNITEEDRALLKWNWMVSPNENLGAVYE